MGCLRKHQVHVQVQIIKSFHGASGSFEVGIYMMVGWFDGP